MKIGVIGLQGAVSEHIGAVRRAMSTLGIKGSATWVRRLGDLDTVDGLIIPGGESTTIARLMKTGGLLERIQERARRGMPIMGTCAGLILLAKEGDSQVAQTGQSLLGFGH